MTPGLYAPPWLREAQKMLGVREGPGALDNPAVIKLYAEAGHSEIKHDDVAWCAAFVGAMLHRVGQRNTGSLAARSYEQFPHLHAPMYGCIGVKKRAGGLPYQGHVGFVVAFDGVRVWMLGGNQNDMVSVAAFAADQFTAFVVPPGFSAKMLSPCPKSYAAPSATVKEA